MRPLEHALNYAKAGWYVFPLKPGSKIPLLPVSWKTLSTTDAATINGWLEKYPDANYAVDCEKSGFVVIDLDTKGGKNGPEEFEKLAKENSETAGDTRVVNTPSGGVHLYYRGTAASCGGLRSGVDTRGAGGYVVGPGSHLAGNVYHDKQNSEIAVLPGWLASAIGKRPQPAAKADGAGAPAPLFTSAADLAQAKAWIATARVAVEGDGGDLHTYKTACSLRDMGLSEEDALHLLWTEWNEYCDPPWTLEGLAGKVDHAYKYGTAPAAIRSINIFDAAEIPKEDMITQIGAFLAPPPKREWVVDGWIPKGAATLLAGEGGVGKSGILLQLSCNVSSGTPWLGLTVACPMPTLYVACEDPYDELHRRYNGMFLSPEFMMLNPKKLPAYAICRIGCESRLMVLGPDGRTPRTGGFMAVLEKQLSKYMPPGPKLLIIDTVPDTFGGNENDRSHVNHFSKQILGHLIQQYDCTVVANAHPAKAEGSEYSGSTAWNGAFRARLQMSYHADGVDFRTLDLRKTNYARPGAQVVMKRSDDGVFRVATTEDALADACVAVFRDIKTANFIGVWVTTAKIKEHGLAARPIAGLDGKHLTEQVKLDAAAMLISKGLLTEQPAPTGKSRMLVAVNLEDMLK